MPAILTHDFFGRGVVDDASDLLGFKTVDERDAFLLGNQGPDPLFYLVIDPLMKKWSPLGNIMHDARPAALLLAMREAAERLEGRERQIAKAYVAGFAGHWQLDSAMHPFVYFWQYGICDAGVPGLSRKNGSRVHAEIERDFDEMVLYTMTGRTVERYRPHERVLLASSKVLEAVNKVYFYMALWVYGRATDPRVFSTAVHEFRLTQRVFDSPHGAKREALGTIERLVTHSPYSMVCSMSHRSRASLTSDFDNHDHRPWENPFTHEVATTDFWDIYNGAQAKILRTIDELFSPGFDLDASRKLTGDVNFEGYVSAPDDAFEW